MRLDASPYSPCNVEDVDARHKAGHDVGRLCIHSSCPRLSRASTTLQLCNVEGVDGRDKPGHDVESLCLIVMPTHDGGEAGHQIGIVMPGFMPGIHVFKALQRRRCGWHRKLGLPDFRVKKCCKSGLPDFRVKKCCKSDKPDLQ